MTRGQKESVYMAYVSACNGFIYCDDLYNDKTVSPQARRDIGLILNKFKWIKTAMEIRANNDALKSVDTLRYDEILRLVMNLSEEQQDKLEKIIKKFVDDEVDKVH